jgi:hypothetical protein
MTLYKQKTGEMQQCTTLLVQSVDKYSKVAE